MRYSELSRDISQSIYGSPWWEHYLPFQNNPQLAALEEELTRKRQEEMMRDMCERFDDLMAYFAERSGPMFPLHIPKEVIDDLL